MVEKDLTKFFRKILNMEDIPIKGLIKWRSQSHAFLSFETKEQKDRLQELFYTEIMPKQPKIRLKPLSKKIQHKDFHPVKAREEQKQENERKKVQLMESLTKEEIEEEMKISIEDKVTPYHHLPYEE